MIFYMYFKKFHFVLQLYIIELKDTYICEWNYVYNRTTFTFVFFTSSVVLLICVRLIICEQKQLFVFRLAYKIYIISVKDF